MNKESNVQVYVNTRFLGHWPVGTAAVVVAESPERAAQLLEAALDAAGLIQVVLPEHMQPIDTSKEAVDVLCNGDY